MRLQFDMIWPLKFGIYVSSGGAESLIRRFCCEEEIFCQNSTFGMCDKLVRCRFIDMAFAMFEVSRSFSVSYFVSLGLLLSRNFRGA
jgi:hypothetical protein